MVGFKIMDLDDVFVPSPMITLGFKDIVGITVVMVVFEILVIEHDTPPTVKVVT